MNLSESQIRWPVAFYSQIRCLQKGQSRYWKCQPWWSFALHIGHNSYDLTIWRWAGFWFYGSREGLESGKDGWCLGAGPFEISKNWSAAMAESDFCPHCKLNVCLCECVATTV